MDPTTLRLIQGAAGAAASGPLYVDDVFTTNLWDGTGSTQTITNGIDLNGKGGMVWTKVKDYADSHTLADSERGKTGTYFDEMASDSTYSSQTTRPWGISSFNSDGFTLGGDNNQFNSSSYEYCSWTFRKAPGFFDVVTYSGTSSSRTVSHNLGSVPGCIIVKSTSASGDWYVYHRSLGTTQYVLLNGNNGVQSHSAAWGGAAPTSTEFSLGFFSNNTAGTQYVAYLFAHDESNFGENEDESIVYCGSFSSATGTTMREVNLGWEPQYVILFAGDSNASQNPIFDSARGFGNDNYSEYGYISKAQRLIAGDNYAESASGRITLTPTGFKIVGSYASTFIAIRRPHKPPEAGTDVFHISTAAENTNFNVGFVTDLTWVKSRDSSSDWFQGARLTGKKYLAFQSDELERTAYWMWDAPTNQNRNPVVSNTPITYSLRRAPGFMDVVSYVGTGSNQNIDHNLTVAPEMMWVKRRDANNYWAVYHSARGSSQYHDGFRQAEKFDSSSSMWNSTSPTTTQFTVGTSSRVNDSFSTYLAVLFGTVDGISKVGSYNGTGSALNVDCGFTGGARLVIIKRANTVTTGSGNTDPSHWFLFDSTRGIVSGNDPFLLLNDQGPQFTGDNALTPLSSGFTVNGGGKGLNVSGGQYVFFAIA